MRVSHDKRLPSWLIGLVLVVLIAIGSVLAYTKELPWGSKYEAKAVFASAQSVQPSAPVRIAGVNVGKVSSVEPLGSAEAEELSAQAGGEASGIDDAPGQEAAIVTMELNEDALPLHEDATFKLRPRLFLEGNYFVDVSPGSPNAETVEDGETFPISQTSYSVQLDQVLTTLQGDVREDLQVFLDQFGNALIKYGGAEGFRELYRTSAAAGKFTSQVNQAVLGERPGDLQGVIKGLDRVVNALGRNEATLQDLVTNFRIFSGSFAQQDVALGRAIEQLPGVLEAARPAFANLNAAFPSVRAFAREALPGVRSTPATLDAATPFVRQVKLLVSKRELRGLVADLRPTIPKLALLSTETVPFLKQTRAVSSCFNEVVIPWSNDTVQPVDPSYPFPPTGRVFEETAYGLSGIASESRSGDANGQYIRVLAGGGTNTIRYNNAVPALTGGLTDAVGVTPFPIAGAMPRLEDSDKTPFKPDVACETQEPPNLQGGNGAPPEQAPAASAAPDTSLLADAKPKEIREAAGAAGLPLDGAKALVDQVADLVEDSD